MARQIFFTAKDAGDWMNLLPVGSAFMQKGYNPFALVEKESVSAKKIAEKKCGVAGAVFYNASADELFQIFDINGQASRGYERKTIISGMSSTYGRSFAGRTNHVFCVPGVPGEAFKHWVHAPRAVFVNTDVEISLVERQWDGKTEAIKTGYPYLDGFARALGELDRRTLRSQIGLDDDEKLVWIAADKEGAPKMMEMALCSLDRVDSKGVVVFPNVHPGASEEDKVDVEKILAKYNFRYLSETEFPSYEARMLASDVVIAAVQSSMPIQARHAGASAIGLTTPDELVKLEYYIGTKDPKEYALVQGGHIATADSVEALTRALEQELKESQLVPMPELDGRASKRIVDEICKYV